MTNKTYKTVLLILVSGIWLALSSAQAAHIDPQEAQHLLQWDQRQQFFKSWLAAKSNRSKTLFEGLLDGHSESTGNYRVTKTLSSNFLTLDDQNNLWIAQAVRAYHEQDWLEAQHALSQLVPPVSDLLQSSTTLLQQLSSMKLQQPLTDRTIIEDPALAHLYGYNLALQLSDNGQPRQALQQIEQLLLKHSQSDPHITDRIYLLKAYLLAETQSPQLAAPLLQRFTSSHPLAAIKQQLETHIQLKDNNPSGHLNLLFKQAQQSPSQLSASNVQLFEELQRQGAETQASLIASEWLPPLQRQYAALLDSVNRVNSAAVLQQLSERQSGAKSGNTEALLSKESRILVTEIERINLLTEQLKGQIPLLKPQHQLFNNGPEHLRSLMEKHQNSVPIIGARLPDHILNGDPKIRSLESRVNLLVGQPDPWEQRYVLLDGLAIWSSGVPFKNRWWEKQTAGQPVSVVDFNAANEELAIYAAEQLSKTALVVDIRIEQELPKLPILEQRATALLKQLEHQKVRLVTALSQSLQFEPAQLVLKTERDLLWLSTQIAPRAHQFDQPEQQRWFDPTQSEPGRLPENTLPPFELALSALRGLADNALNDQIKYQATRHLADLKLLISERILQGDSITPHPDITPASAISLYQWLLQTKTPANDRAQILYQLAKAHELNAEPEESLAALAQLLDEQPEHPLLSEIQFRIAELHFGLRNYDLAAEHYRALLTEPVAGTAQQQAPSSDEFLDKARYKLAWSSFKQGDYPGALDSFFVLIDRHWQPQIESASQVPQKALLDDTLRVVALTFAYMEGADSVRQYFTRVGPKDYETQVYLNLGAYYEYKHRFTDTAETYNLLVERFPQSDDAPWLQSRVISAYTEGGFPSKAWPAREHFIERFGVNSLAWKQADETQRDRIREHLAGYLVDLAQRDHALAQQSRLSVAPSTDNKAVQRQHYALALGWYDQFITAMPTDARLPEIYFLKAEALSETGQIEQAAALYEQVAYQSPGNPRSAEAGYAALLAYQSLYQAAPKESDIAQKWLQTGIDQSQRFSLAFPDSSYSAKVQTKLAEDWLLQNNYVQAIDFASRLLQDTATHDLDIELRRRLWRVSAHASFDTANYAQAEQAYHQLVALEPEPDELETLLRRLAESIYQQGDLAQKSGDSSLALGHYQRLRQVVPGSHILPQAEFDAATLLLQLKSWPEAVLALEAFRNDHPQNTLQATIDDKLVVAYEQTQNWPKAAQALQRIFDREGGSDLGRDALWRSAALEEKAGQLQGAAIAYQRFIETFPSPHEAAMEARLKLYQLAQQTDDNATQLRWLQAIIQIETTAMKSKGSAASTDRSLYIASDAAMILGKLAMSEFLMQPLNLPLEKSLTLKRKAMESSIRYLTQTSNFGLAQQSTEATALIGKIYQEFAQSLISSQRPKQLSELELEQYQALLEEQALPFEDKAISLHEINISRIAQEIYTAGISSSLDALRQMMPARYAKDERVPEYNDAIE